MCVYESSTFAPVGAQVCISINRFDKIDDRDNKLFVLTIHDNGHKVRDAVVVVVA